MARSERKYSRWSCLWSRTRAHWAFSAHHTELNQFYWSYARPAGQHFRAARAYTGTWPPAAWHVGPDDLKREVYAQQATYTKAYSGLMNWVRLSAAMAMCSYFEVFLRRITSAALESNPGLLLGVSKSVDGVVLMKARSEYSFPQEVDQVAAGTWTSRVTHYERFFGSAPAAVRDNVAELDALRVVRNKVGHHFGRDEDLAKTVRAPDPMIRVSEKRLVKWLGLVSEAAKQIDQHLIPLIGDFEIVRMLHEWRQHYKGNHIEEPRAFSKHVSATYGGASGKSYFRTLVDYYKSA